MNYGALNDRELLNRCITSTDPLTMELAKRLEEKTFVSLKEQRHAQTLEEGGQLRLFNDA